jgi:hypothetical protein
MICLNMSLDKTICDCGYGPLQSCQCGPKCKCNCPCANKDIPMSPDRLALELRNVADRIDKSRFPNRHLVAKDLRRVILSIDDKLPDFWVTREEIAFICPPCAERMASLRINRVLASAIFGQDILHMAGEQVAEAWESMPGGWTPESRKKFWNSIGKSVTKCIKKMEGKVDDPAAFCASLKDKVEKA